MHADPLLLKLSLQEDLGPKLLCDLTTESLFPVSTTFYSANIISKHSSPVIICGLPLVRQLLDMVSHDYELHSDYVDGQILNPGQTLMTLCANAQLLLKTERIILNFLRHLSAIATLTHQYVDLIRHTATQILDTRKTTPGLRGLEKYAVYCGGGTNHRMGLYDAIMVKDTHIDLLGGIKNALERLPGLSVHQVPVVVEVRSMDELAIVLAYGRSKVTRILFDNMPLDELATGVAHCRGVFETESSGNITQDTILAIAQTGVDYASVGELTYRAGHVDLSMYTS